MGNKVCIPLKQDTRLEGTSLYTRPTGAIAHRGINLDRLRRLILAGKLAPCFPGTDEEEAPGRERQEECPLCMLVRLSPPRVFVLTALPSHRPLLALRG